MVVKGVMLNKATIAVHAGIFSMMAVRRLFKSKGGSSSSGIQTMNCHGVPWNQETPLWHGTLGFSKIMNQNRFKARRQLADGQVKNAAGGGTDKAVSMTADFRVALSVCIGLNVFRKIAQNEITALQLIEYSIDQGLPVKPNNIQDAMIIDANTSEAGLTRKRSACFNIYQNILMQGSRRKKVYNPLFWGTNIEDFLTVSEDDIGVICAKTSIPRVIFEDWGYVYFGYLTQSEMRSHHAMLSEMFQTTEDSVEGYEYSGCYNIYRGSGRMIGSYRWENIDDKPTGSNTLIGKGAMSEIRVYDPSKLAIIDSESKKLSEIMYEGVRATEMIAFPYFEEN